MIANGTAWTRPVSDAALTPRASAMSGWNSEISLWMMPITRAAATVTPNDEKRPTRAAASAGITAIDSTAGVERHDRGEEDGGERGQAPGNGEVQELDLVGRPAGARRDPAVLGDRRAGE